MNLCIIPARGGSKRILGKNIKNFCGKPIISYSIEAALRSGCFDTVVVSTDDEEIADVAIKYGAKVPFIRPEGLSNDFVGTLPVINHAIEWYRERNRSFSYVCCIYATAPLILVENIQNSLYLLKEQGSEYVFSVTSFPFPIQRAIKKLENGRLGMFYPEQFNTRSQDLDEAFHDAGQFYWGRSEAFLKEYPLFSECAIPFVLPRYRVQDIDTPEDWIRAELMYSALQRNVEKVLL